MAAKGLKNVNERFPVESLAARLRELGAVEVLVKRLAPNDNSKNQIYLAGDISSLGLLPTGEVEFTQGTSVKRRADKRGPIFRSSIDIWWMRPDGGLSRAPNSKLILYPQYSEVRLSGFLSGCEAPPSELFDIHKRGREQGRVLVFAPLPDRRVIAIAFSADSDEARAIYASKGEPYGVMRRFDLGLGADIASEERLLTELRRIHLLGWLDPVYLEKDGSFRPCRGTNCGGVTLESHLGVMANGYSEPDFHGWEVKQHNVGSWAHPKAGRITLMTPEPSGGAYVEEGPKYFVRTWGYEDQRGRLDRLNFGGIYRVGGIAHNRTGLRMILSGFDEPTGRFEGDGAVMLVDHQDRVAASWSFAKLLDHWKRKHAKAVFVPSIVRADPSIQYEYGAHIALAERGRFNLLLRAFAYGSVHYDPGIKLEGVEAGENKLKRRSQFRIDSRYLASLYESYRQVDLLNC
jgi:hypothetical protein